MVRSLKASAFALFALVATLSINPSHAAESPSEFIERLARTAISTLTESALSLEERQDRFRMMLRNGFDIDAVSRFLLGPFRRKASDDELLSFREALEDNVVATYAWRFGAYNGQRFEVTGFRDGRRGRKIVNSVIEPVDGSESISVDWTLSPHDDTWRIFDISIEGLSMLVTQRDEYASVIRRNGGEIGALTKALKAQSERLNKKQRRASSS